MRGSLCEPSGAADVIINNECISSSTKQNSTVVLPYSSRIALEVNLPLIVDVVDTSNSPNREQNGHVILLPLRRVRATLSESGTRAPLQEMVLDGRSSRLTLFVALLLRLLYVFRPSYLHPDEHLQGPQEIAYGVFNWASHTPWEFRPPSPVRSFVPLWLLYGLPMRFFNAHADPVHVLWTLRGVFAVLTWVLEDMAVDRLANTRNDKLRFLFFANTSYVTLTWQAHTFSNSLETLLVLWFLVILFETESATSQPFMTSVDMYYDSFLLGVIVTLGVFNRPTFLAFILVPAVLQMPRVWRRSRASFFVFATSLATCSMACVYIDTYLYNGSSWVVTPYNFLLYNSQSTNLELHGLDNRLKHVFNSLPTLLGPGLLMLRPQWTSLSTQTILSGLVLLSVIPHQEPRFLLPLVPLFCTQMNIKQFKSIRVRKLVMRLWLSFNLVFGLLMGVFHQAGVIPAQVAISEYVRPLSVVWWRTYTPPLWVTGLPSQDVQFVALSELDASKAEVLEVSQRRPAENTLAEIDLQGADIETLREVLAAAAPALVVVPNIVRKDFLELFRVGTLPERIWHTWFHLDPSRLVNKNHAWSSPFGLGIYNVTAACELL